MKPTWHGFASILAEDMQAYLHHKRALKRKFQIEESVLRLLDRYLVEHEVGALTAITPTLIEDFLGSRPRRHARSYACMGSDLPLHNSPGVFLTPSKLSFVIAFTQPWSFHQRPLMADTGRSY